MARTEQATALTEQHRQAQVQVQGHALRDFMLLWPLWTGDTESFGRLVQAAMPLVRSYHHISASIAAAYYQAFRAAEDVTAPFSPPAIAPVVEARITASLHVTGNVMTRDALAAGQSPAQARQTALIRTSGAVTRHVAAGGREAIIDTVQADPQARGWARITDGDPCAFCLVLASRGFVYKTESAASFEAHDHCGCTAEPAFEGSTVPAQSQRWLEIYDRAQREGVESGLLQPGENSSSARINAVRRLLTNR